MKIRSINTLANQRGMTLVEILIVITLIAVVGTFVAGQFLDRLDEGNVNAAKIQISNFKSLLEDYRRLCNQYPTADQGLEALIAKPSTPPDCPNYPSSGFIQGSNKVPVDPWNTPYIYESDGTKYLITCLGKDKKEGGEKAAADIKSTDL